MSDIFMSYAREDLDRIRPLVETFQAQGWSVWWDRRIPAGLSFDEVIDRELAAARCVVVPWSQHSIGSRWVRTEASEALERGILVPTLLDDVLIPLEFRRVQAARLTGWRKGVHSDELDWLLESIRLVLGGRVASGSLAPPRTRSGAAGPIETPAPAANNDADSGTILKAAGVVLIVVGGLFGLGALMGGGLLALIFAIPLLGLGFAVWEQAGKAKS